jgi:hypothetical protein
MLKRIRLVVLHYDQMRPRTREDCAGVLRPCPYVTCRHNLFVDGTEGKDGRSYLKKSCAEPDQMDPKSSCVLDVVEDNPDGMSQGDVARAMGLTQQRVDQLERSASEKLKGWSDHE